MSDDFRGDNAQLIASINALIELDADNALRPHGLGGHARGLLSAAAARLAASPDPAPSQQDMIAKAARCLADRSADACNVNRDDNWKVYGDDFIADAKAMFEAAGLYEAGKKES